ncbi:hypothetical protein Y032_0516g2798 [Ancylostoma ceylanicum]|uniref:Uncharacterized protein n=1 Tax=Ancylostoma ceylanicum TaxID=53326 RepID=A0A016WUV8_9BILA|nr:hypothetical protein Y032_0516g2798 [Ancylostoma ceylanicum]
MVERKKSRRCYTAAYTGGRMQGATCRRGVASAKSIDRGATPDELCHAPAARLLQYETVQKADFGIFELEDVHHCNQQLY